MCQSSAFTSLCNTLAYFPGVLILLESGIIFQEYSYVCYAPYSGCLTENLTFLAYFTQRSIGSELLKLFQTIRCFDFSRFITFVRHLDIHYVYMHIESNVSRKVKTSYNFEQRYFLSFFLLYWIQYIMSY